MIQDGDRFDIRGPYPTPAQLRGIMLGSNTGVPAKHGGSFASRAALPDSPDSTESSPESSDSDGVQEYARTFKRTVSKPFVPPKKIRKPAEKYDPPEPKSSGRVRGLNWVFTLNNPPASLELYAPDFKFLAYQEEIGRLGPKHFPRLLVCKTQQGLKSLQTILPRGIHLELMKGTFDQALAYCMKSDTAVKDSFVSWGEPPVSKGKKVHVSLEDRVAAIKRASLIDLYDANNPDLLQNPAGVKMIKSIQAQAIRSTQPTKKIVDVIILEGPPGCGKSHSALFDICDPQHMPFMLDYYDGQFWVDGYDPSNIGHKTILMDDFSCKPKIDIMLRFLDCYPVSFQVKGGFVTLSHNTLILTTNIPVRDWYEGDVRQSALHRRIGQYGLYLRWNDVLKEFVEDKYYKDQWKNPIHVPLPPAIRPPAFGFPLLRSARIDKDYLKVFTDAAKLDLDED